MISKFLLKNWYQKKLTPAMMLLLPFTIMFRLLILLRRYAYQIGLHKRYTFDVPVIVIGNIAIGGTGKTPLLMSLISLLRDHGYRPAVVSRGYGGQSNTVITVTKATDVSASGDEALMIVKKMHCPLAVSPKRPAAVAKLIAETDCNVILSDDGLQHYALMRDIEIAVVDGQRRFGNGWCLPAGPLREPVSRLRQVDFIVSNGNAHSGEYEMNLVSEPFVYRLLDGEKCHVSDFNRVHAVAAIGNPQRFFDTLRQLGLDIIEHAFADHYQFTAKDICFADNLPVMMTEKDAVKCQVIAGEQHWSLPVAVVLNASFEQALVTKLNDFTKQKINAITHC